MNQKEIQTSYKLWSNKYKTVGVQCVVFSLAYSTKIGIDGIFYSSFEKPMTNIC